MSKVPAHVAVIMDGNGRWARTRGNDRVSGHRAGAEAARQVVRASIDNGVGHLTLYTFSSENWNRPPIEVKALMSLLVEMVLREIDEMNRDNVRLHAIGDLSRLPEKALATLEDGIEKTRGNTGLQLYLALSYGGRWEITEAARKLARAAQTGRLSPDEIDETMFSRHLETPGVPDPDLVIRTGGDRRLSNFLLWQAAYAELWFTDTLWPDFGREEFGRALEAFSGRERRFGRVLED